MPTCQLCGKPLTGRQIKWCSDDCALRAERRRLRAYKTEHERRRRHRMRLEQVEAHALTPDEEAAAEQAAATIIATLADEEN